MYLNLGLNAGLNPGMNPDFRGFLFSLVLVFSRVLHALIILPSQVELGPAWLPECCISCTLCGSTCSCTCFFGLGLGGRVGLLAFLLVLPFHALYILRGETPIVRRDANKKFVV